MIRTDAVAATEDDARYFSTAFKLHVIDMTFLLVAVGHYWGWWGVALAWGIHGTVVGNVKSAIKFRARRTS